MNLFEKLQRRAAAGSPVRVGLVGAGKFGSMVLSQVPKIPGLHMVAVVDLDVGKTRTALERVNWPAEKYGAKSIADAIREGTTFVTDDVSKVFRADEIECITSR